MMITTVQSLLTKERRPSAFDNRSGSQKVQNHPNHLPSLNLLPLSCLCWVGPVFLRGMCSIILASTLLSMKTACTKDRPCSLKLLIMSREKRFLLLVPTVVTLWTVVIVNSSPPSCHGEQMFQRNTNTWKRWIWEKVSENAALHTICLVVQYLHLLIKDGGQRVSGMMLNLTFKWMVALIQGIILETMRIT